MHATGIQLPGVDELGRETCLEYARIAEDRGLETIWTGESWGHSAVPLLTQLLERTESIDVCSGIFNVYSRSPALVAMTTTALAELSDGRVRVGLGTSGPQVIENFHGEEFRAPLRRTREYVEIVRSFCRGERVEYDGEFFDLSGFAIDADDHYDPPIYVAAMGDLNRQLTGEFADGWIPLLVPHTGLEEGLTAVERGADRGDRSLDDIDVAPWIPTCISPDDPDAAREHVRSFIAFYVGAMGDFYAETARRFGFSAEADAIQEGWETDRQAGAESAVTDEMVDAFGACGTPEEAAATFDAFVDAGADSPIAYLPAHWAPPERIRTTIEHL